MKRVLKELVITRIAAVDRPCQEHATCTILKRRPDDEDDGVELDLSKVINSDKASDWIDDFVHSDNKKFKGKSKEERINMALGAFYSKRFFDAQREDSEMEIIKTEKLGKLHIRVDAMRKEVLKKRLRVAKVWSEEARQAAADSRRGKGGAGKKPLTSNQRLALGITDDRDAPTKPAKPKDTTPAAVRRRVALGITS